MFTQSLHVSPKRGDKTSKQIDENIEILEGKIDGKIEGLEGQISEMQGKMERTWKRSYET